MDRSRPTTCGSVSRTASMSLSFVYRPRLKRSEPWENSCGRPMAVRTCEGLQAGGRAGRTGRTGDPQHVQAEDHPLPFDGLHGEVDVVGEPPRGMAVQADPVEPFEDAADEAVPHGGQPRRLFGKRRPGQLHRLPETDDPGDVQGGGPAAAFLLAAVHERRDPRPLPDVQQPHPFRPVELVGRGAQEIDVQFIHRKRQMAEGLNGVRMETDPPLPRHRCRSRRWAGSSRSRCWRA